VSAHPYHRKLARTLDRMGAVYTVQDILAAIASGRMQSFAEGESWAITQVVNFPRARMLEVLAAIGDLEQCRKLHDRILQYAADNGIALIQAYGRRGWIRDAESRGWKIKTTSFLYQREM
jgi:hypothetical protein